MMKNAKERKVKVLSAESKKVWGQVSLELTFAIVVAFVLFVGMARAFQWSGWELGAQRRDHMNQIKALTKHHDDIEAALDPDFYIGSDVDAAVASNIFH